MDCKADVIPRGRCNTWPPPLQDDLPTSHFFPPVSLSSHHPGQQQPVVGESGGCPMDPQTAAVPPNGNAKKGVSTRRNAWGGMSYADLITAAISSTPDGRLTLAQIYDWVVANIPYFKDKGDSNSSAGWKVGIPCFGDACFPPPQNNGVTMHAPTSKRS
ncbi:Forkhead box protein O [Portunus trituberculatus]|uniref:Forkhead box protein O n=1 Tax=Portunus trituberculatus TaxID=210409 RepID=A0A5B7F102_PORTR|nr:Forkhead box protein O [Portunus trituberculatus]